MPCENRSIKLDYDGSITFVTAYSEITLAQLAAQLFQRSRAQNQFRHLGRARANVPISILLCDLWTNRCSGFPCVPLSGRCCKPWRLLWPCVGSRLIPVTCWRS